MTTLSLISFLQSYGWRGKAVHSRSEINALLRVYLDESEKADSIPAWTEHAANFFDKYEGLELYSRNSCENESHIAISLNIKSVYGSFNFDIPMELALPTDSNPAQTFPLGMYAVVGNTDETRLKLLTRRLSEGEGRWVGTVRILILTGSGEVYSYGEGFIFKHSHSLFDFFERFRSKNELFMTDQKYIYRDDFLAKNE